MDERAVVQWIIDLLFNIVITLLLGMYFQLEVRLAEKEENLLERDLVFEQVTRITERVNSKVVVGKDDSLALAKKVRKQLWHFAT